MKPLDVVGVQEIGDMIGKDTGHVSVLVQRGKLPKPAAVVGGRKLWRRSTIEKWIRETRYEPAPQEERT